VALLRLILLLLDILLDILPLVEWELLLQLAAPLNMVADPHSMVLQHQEVEALLRNNMRIETMRSRLRELAEVKRNSLLA
jgi:hypothetical protein